MAGYCIQMQSVTAWKPARMDPHQLLMDSFLAAVRAADPMRVIPAQVEDLRASAVTVIGAGKAAASMAAAVESVWADAAGLAGTVATRHGHAVPTRRIEVLEAGHPVPDQASLAAGEKIMSIARSLRSTDMLLALWSGGGSSLMSWPEDGIALADYQHLMRSLLRGGVPIGQMNTLRKHLSRSQGGKLAAASAARIRALVVSDVPGDDLSAIASGPTSPDPTTFGDCLDILDRWRIDAPASVLAHLRAGADGCIAETPKPGHERWARVDARVVASSRLSLEAASERLHRAGLRVINLGDEVSGEARKTARVHAMQVRELHAARPPGSAPVALLSGGECTVTVRGQGRGGRCAEYLLQLFADLRDLPGIHALACDTDGIDGTQDNAGAWFGPQALARAAATSLDPVRALEDNDSYGFFSALDTLVVTGPTRTNVNDFRCIII